LEFRSGRFELVGVASQNVDLIESIFQASNGRAEANAATTTRDNGTAAAAAFLGGCCSSRFRVGSCFRSTITEQSQTGPRQHGHRNKGGHHDETGREEQGSSENCGQHWDAFVVVVLCGRRWKQGISLVKHRGRNLGCDIKCVCVWQLAMMTMMMILAAGLQRQSSEEDCNALLKLAT